MQFCTMAVGVSSLLRDVVPRQQESLETQHIPREHEKISASEYTPGWVDAHSFHVHVGSSVRQNTQHCLDAHLDDKGSATDSHDENHVT